MSLQDIKDEYAVTQSFQNWIHLMQYHILIDSQHVLDAHFNNVMTITQKECLKRASENAWNGYVVTGIQNVADDVKESITNENNIIK